MANENETGNQPPQHSSDYNSFQHPFGGSEIREVIAIAKDTNIDPAYLIDLMKETNSKMHVENMRYWELREKKLNMDYGIAQRSQDYALLVSVISTVSGSLIAYLTNPWAGAAIAGAGAGVASIATAKRMLSKSGQTIEGTAIPSQ